MSFTIRIEDDNTEKIKNEVHEAILDGLDAAGVQAVSIATVEIQKEPQRVDTGLLKNSIAYAVVGKSAIPSTYSADGPDKDGVVHEGSYSGIAPDEGEDKPYVMIGTNVEYALYVHEGTSRMKANRFIKRAVEENKDELLEIVAKGLRKI